MSRRGASRTLENAMRRMGFARIAGVDEVGRGCLAGPVVAGAVVLDPGTRIPGLRDSKLLTPEQRDRLHDAIIEKSAAWAIGSADPSEIDRLNIHRATLLAMDRAVRGLPVWPDLVLVDAFRMPGLPVAQRAVIGGDRRCSAIAAASIVAKVWRDRLMARCHESDPRYGFDRHKGYATAQHLSAVARFGYSAIHRRSFRRPSLFDGVEDGA